MRPDAHLRLELDPVVPERPPLPRPAPLVLALLRVLRRPPVKVRHVVVVPEGICPGAHPAVLVMVVLRERVMVMVVMIMPRTLARVVRVRARCLVVRLLPLVGLRAPAAAAVEARWRTAECAPPSAQAARGAAAGGRRAAVVRGAGARGVRGRGVLVQAEDVAVVGGAARRVGEDGVGLGEEGEGVGGRGVVGVYVRVVGFGEAVEGSA